ncbi:MAG: [FeFe] hydrogenase H-cluster maturation GTPase HydF [Planctomycetaceae bacterium]|jgi:[FeFe] hydrogenase H-cluster maturation GTPase HydF|nr:[FeFe] hydrogenase H-cluster maturation GTPase HydF [Planctomycetaceae bacterium]
MGLNDTPSSNRIHIGFFGLRNAGKSSLVNAITGQELAVVSEMKGTTTDPVFKAMELLPLGPVMIIDTPGFDDEGTLGELRVRKAKQVLNKTDVAVLVVDIQERPVFASRFEKQLVNLFQEKQIPFIVAITKCDLHKRCDAVVSLPSVAYRYPAIGVSAKTGSHIKELKERIAALAQTEEPKLRIVGDIIHPSDFVVLVVPIDKAAPKGRLILPQQQTIRDILEADATAVLCKEYELKETLENLAKKPQLVITDSQVFAKVAADTPPDVLLTSFSILFARYKGSLIPSVRGARTLDELKDGDTVLIAEGCTHHRQCDDIGTVKLPRWIRNYAGKEVKFEFTSGTEFPDELKQYKLVIHCGGCMLNEREMKYRMKCAADQNVPITNYGIAIAFMQGILKRTLQPFPGILAELE